jgi:hypothetical protein
MRAGIRQKQTHERQGGRTSTTVESVDFHPLSPAFGAAMALDATVSDAE